MYAYCPYKTLVNYLRSYMNNERVSLWSNTNWGIFFRCDFVLSMFSNLLCPCYPSVYQLPVISK